MLQSIEFDIPEIKPALAAFSSPIPIRIHLRRNGVPRKYKSSNTQWQRKIDILTFA